MSQDFPFLIYNTPDDEDDTVVVSKMEITTAHGAMPDKTQKKEVQFLAEI